MRGQNSDDHIGGMIAAFSSYSGSVIGHVKAMARESIISLAVRVSLVFVGAMIILIAVAFLMLGASKGLVEALGIDLWLASLITGAGFLLPAFFFIVFVSFKSKRESLKKKAEQKKAAEKLSLKISEVADIRTWIQEYPFYSAGAAAAAGFTLSGITTPDNSKESDAAEKIPEPRPANIQNSIIALILALAENVLKETVFPFVKEHLRSEKHTEKL